MEKQTLTTKQKRSITDFIRQTDTEVDEVRRAQAVLLLDQGADKALIEQLTTYGRSHSFQLRRRYLKEGFTAFEDKRQGDPKPLLTKKQRQAVLTILQTRKPSEVGYVGEGWTTRMLGDYIKRQYKVEYKSRTSYYLLFKEAKFTYHKPEKRYEKYDEAKVKKWRQQTRKRLKAAWDESATEIICEDEMVLSTQTTVQKVWLPAGQAPKIEVNQKKENRSVYGFLNVQTGQEHAWKTKWQNMYETVKVLKKVRKQYPQKKLLILWDSARWHVGSKVREYIKQDGNIETLAFPPYSPEENPQEHVWKKGRAEVTHNRFLADIDQATNGFVRYLRKTSFNYKLLALSPVS